MASISGTYGMPTPAVLLSELFFLYIMSSALVWALADHPAASVLHSCCIAGVLSRVRTIFPRIHIRRTGIRDGRAGQISLGYANTRLWRPIGLAMMALKQGTSGPTTTEQAPMSRQDARPAVSRVIAADPLAMAPESPAFDPSQPG